MLKVVLLQVTGQIVDTIVHITINLFTLGKLAMYNTNGEGRHTAAYVSGAQVITACACARARARALNKIINNKKDWSIISLRAKTVLLFPYLLAPPHGLAHSHCRTAQNEQVVAIQGGDTVPLKNERDSERKKKQGLRTLSTAYLIGCTHGPAQGRNAYLHLKLNLAKLNHITKKLSLTTHTALWKPRRPTSSAALTSPLQPGAAAPVAVDIKK